MRSILASYVISETEDRIRKSLLQFFFHSLDDLLFSGSPFHIRVYPFYGHILPFSVISSQHLYQNEFNLEQSSLAEVWGSAVWIYQPKLPRDSSIVYCSPSSLISRSQDSICCLRQEFASLWKCAREECLISMCKQTRGEQSPACGGRVQVHAFRPEVGISSL